MFEYHGWAVLRERDTEADISPELLQELDKNIRAGNAHVETNQWEHVLLMTGLRNHRHEDTIDTFRWIAAHLPGSYGLLYVWDDEISGHSDTDFRVYRLARGRRTEHGDPFLSQRLPTIEEPDPKDV